MYNILIADDEQLIRKGIIAKLTYNKFEYGEIIEANDGDEALDLIKTRQPDIAITDIKMPNMDGIELIKKAKKLSPKTKFIIISGYAEFSYAEQAVNLGVKGYLLKPIGNENFRITISRVYKELENDKKVKRITSKKKLLEKYCDELSLEQKLNMIFHSREDTCTVLSNSKNKYILAIINIDGKSYYQSHFKYQDIDLIKFSITNICNEIKIQCSKIVFNNLDNKNQILIFFSHINYEMLKVSTNKYLVEILTKIKKYLKISITIGLSNIQNNITYKLYIQANKAINRKMIYGENKIYKFEYDIQNTDILLPINEINLLEKCIHRSDLTNIKAILHSIFSNKYIKNNPIIYTRMVWFEITNILIKLCNDLCVDTDITVNRLLLNEKIIEKFDNIEQIINYLYSSILDVLRYKNIDDMNFRNRIKLAIKYIQSHYQEPITVNDLSNKFGINSTYFSTLFKKETNTTVIKYLTQIRLKNACMLLKNSKDSVINIARKVGFDDPQYFFRVFKKNIGKTPLEYKKVH